MKTIKSFDSFVSENKNFKDKIKNDGYFSDLSLSTSHKKEAQMKKQANLDDDNSDAYKKMPGDTKGKKSLKKSKHTTNYEDLYSNESLYESSTGDRSPIDNPDIETALKKKKKETGVPLPLLRIVMRRGMAAWKSGHRPGAGQEQWGYARINSFLTKAPGTWGRPVNDPKPKTGDAYGADADVAQEVIKGGFDKDLKKG
jgi:hypothetical protein